MIDAMKRMCLVTVMLVAACSASAANTLAGKWGAAAYTANHGGIIGMDFSSSGVVTITTGGMFRTTSATEYDVSKPGVIVLKGPYGSQPYFYRIEGNVLTLSLHEDLSDPMTLRRDVSPPTAPPYRSKI
jgi:hypothetical protein